MRVERIYGSVAHRTPGNKNGHRVSQGPALLSTDYVVLDRPADFGAICPPENIVNTTKI